MKATAKDLRFHSKELMDTVSRGEEVLITFRGKPCAKLVPVGKKKGANAQNELFGMWKDHSQTKDIDKYVRNVRKERFQ